MGIPKKALRHKQLKYLTTSAPVDGSHQTSRVSFEEDGVTKNAFFKKLDPKNHYPELLAKISVATSSFKRLFQGKRSAEERLVFDDAEDKIIGTLSIGIDGFKSFHFASEGIPVDGSLREKVVPSTKTLIEKNFMELLVGRWFLDDDDTHPHNVSLVGDIDFDMFFYWFTIYMKVPRSVIGVPKNQVSLSVRDYETFPNVQESKPYHWPPFPHPGKVTLPVLVPKQDSVLPMVLPKAYADPLQFARLAQDSEAHDQKQAAALKILLTYQPELEDKHLTELLGDLTTNFSSLEESLRKKYEELFPQFCNSKTNVESFVKFIRDLYQEHYDNLYRVVVFYGGCPDNGYGVALSATYQALYQKPSIYRKVVEWVKNENETTYAKEEHLKFSLTELQNRYHQIWRDAFAPTMRELLYDSYILINTLLKETTSPPHAQLSEFVTKQVTDHSVTSAWQLFGTMPELSADVIESKIKVDKESKVRDALLSLVAFTNKFHSITKIYYSKDRKDLTEEDNLKFSDELNSLHREYNLKIRQYLANTTTHAGEFNAISSRLKLVSEQVNFKLHLTTTDELMQESLLSVKKEILPFTHEEVKKQYNDSLFVWAKGLKPEELERHINDIIDKKYAPLWSLVSFRQRSEPVKKYLESSKQESGDNRLAYILCSGTQEGALNTALIDGLTPLMLQKHPITSIDMALREKTFEKGLADFTRDVVSFAKKDKRFTHPLSEEGMSLIYAKVYEWVNTLMPESFKGLINSTLKQYESKLSYISISRRPMVEGCLNGNSPAKALALIFMNGEDSSSLNACLFTKIIETIKREILSGKYPRMKTDTGYQLIAQFDLEEHKIFYLANIKHHNMTIKASNEQLQLTNNESQKKSQLTQSINY